MIRTAEVKDVPAIVDLLKESLGQSVVEKSTAIWNFKHNDNPFGTSHVLLAVENETFVGVRAFMKWDWQEGSKIWNAYRAVDTATHPAFQGKGIFKKLTLQALEDVGKNQETFVFNTPNDKSRPGYLKMGWVVVDALPIAIIPTIIYSFLYIFKTKFSHTNRIETNDLDKLCEAHNQNLSEKNSIFTPKSSLFLKWRFADNPMQNYKILSTDDWYVAMYIKKHKFFKELRVVELIKSNHSDEKEIRAAISRYAIQNRCWIITMADKELFFFKLYGRFGPKLTFKALTKNTLFTYKALNIYNWKYSLGDLELF